MELETIINEESLNEVKKYFIGPKVKRTMLFASILLLVIGLIDLICFNDLTYIIVFVIVEIIIQIELVYLKNKCVKLNLDRIKESLNSNDVRLKLSLNDNNVVLYNPITKGKNKMDYDVFTNYYETDNYSLLKSKSAQLIIIDKNSISKKDKNKMIGILRKNSKDLKFHIK